MNRTSTQVFVLEVMGRHAGWTTAACALAAEQEGDAPHILLLPEVAFIEDRFLAKVDDAFRRSGHCVIAVSEGIKDETVSSSQPARRTPSATHSWEGSRHSSPA